MAVTLEQIVIDVPDLPGQKQEQLLAELIRDLEPRDSASPKEIENVEDTEIARCLEEIDTGKVNGIPAEEVFARLLTKRDEIR